MCSIVGILNISADHQELRRRALHMSKSLRHRGPDWSGIYDHDHAILAHERLSIVDINTGAQPLLNIEQTHILAVNGEIYNHKELEQNLTVNFQFQTKSDCEIILAKYLEKGTAFLDELQGMFAFVLYDKSKNEWLIGRDHMGIIPLYTGYDESGNLYVASELKALVHYCKTITEFPPGHYWSSTDASPVKYYDRDWMSYEAVKNNTSDIDTLRDALEMSVRSHLMTDVPYGVLLSGGLDSSIIAAVAKHFVKKRIEDDDLSEAWWPQLHSFAIGLKDSTDLIAAKKVADYIGTIHHEMNFTIQEGIDALSDVIYHLETFDVTTVRASTPMYLMARRIKAMGIKMVLSGEGSDEIFGGYLYFHKAPDPKEFHEETVRKLKSLHLYDCLRANKSMAAWGVEARVPFLDKVFMDVAMRLNPKDKMAGNGKIEKHILRKAFEEYLPPEIAWRQKEQFSDGVGYSWIDSLKELANQKISDQQMANAKFRFPVNTPATKEAYHYRELFESHFPYPSAIDCIPGGPSVACSTPQAILWDKSLSEITDPSGRSVRSVHNQSY
ncbi:MAG: asparagine synthase B [Saprospiraceae bacterium]|uniref:asparagine synthase (glutamine-hydrolyzing) n=1 Tax=Candidatus Opimibacter skivensis TaxID=2982028 RepID=A0A9D7SVR6_9BACT|nr:asparagine synthase B [Candidatus Opimibacter skivensis]